MGRDALVLAGMSGKLPLLQWLLESNTVPITVSDTCSGDDIFTATARIGKSAAVRWLVEWAEAHPQRVPKPFHELCKLMLQCASREYAFHSQCKLMHAHALIVSLLTTLSYSFHDRGHIDVVQYLIHEKQAHKFVILVEECVTAVAHCRIEVQT